VGIADLDADGRADLVVTHGMSDFVSIFLGNGDGTFDPPTTASVGSTGGSAVARGDFNRDGRQDLAVAVKTSSQVALLLGDGAGGFLGPATTYPVAASPGALVVGDFDRDGDADVATSGGSTVSVLFGDGTGGLLLPRDDYSVGSGADALAQGDFDADGWPDLATANVSAGTVSVLLGNGLGFGDFSPAVSLVSAGSPRGIIAASLDGDGYLDLATVNGSAQSLLVFSGDDNGGFGTAASYSTAPVTSGPVSVTVDDFNRDGIPDLAVPGSSNVAILLGTGSGGFFVPPGTAGAGTSPQHAAVGDFDGDGIPDLAVANLGSNDVSIRRGDGAGGFAPFSPSTDIGGIPSPRFVAAGDFDRDGKVDLVIAHGTNQVAVYGGDGSGGFAAGSPLTAGTTPVFIAVSDFDGNGEPDLAVANSASNDINVCFGGPGLTFSCGAPLGAGTKPVAIAVADFDRDGNPDLAVANENPGGTGSVSRFDNTDGMGTFSLLAPEVSVGTQPKGLVAADFDGDGLTDLALAGFGNRNTSVLLGNGDWTFDPTESWGVGGQPVWVAAGDFDRDGKPDLVTSSQNTSNVSAILNTNCRARRLGVLVDVDPLACPAPATTLTPPLVIRVLDDGGNRIRCDAGNVLASRMPAGPLGGTTTRPVVDGDATFSDLSVGDSGRFRVQFEHGPTADRARSRSFSQGVAVMISGPTELCEAAAAIYNAGPGYDKYTWVLDAPAPPLSVSQHARVSGLSPGPHTLDVQVKQDACTAVDSHLITVQANLSNVSVSPGGLQIVCTSCTGATLMENHLGGGTVTYQWAFRRETDSPPHVDIPGQTGPAYIVNGADFPGPGTYFVVVKTQSSLCGGPPVVSSNEVEVDVVVGPPADAVQFFTITSRSGQNFLEWKNPSGFGTVDIHRIEGTPSCAFPTDPNGPTLLTTKTGTLGQFDSFLDDFVSNDVTYCYTIFVVTDPGPPRQFSSGRSNRGRPFNTSLEVKWAFSIGTATLVPPGLGTEASDGVHAVANDNGLYSIAKGAAGGARPTSWTHVLLDGPSQGRPTTVLVPVPVGGGADRVIFLGSQGGTVHAINAANGGTPLWNAPVAPPLVQAGISGIFRSFPPGDFDYVFAATRVSGVDNQLHALNKDDGSPVGGNWPFDGGGAEGFIGLISGQPLVDYVSKRVYFTSFERNPAPSGDENTVWCVNIADATSCWPSVNRFYGNIAASPTMRGNRIYVGTLDGKVIALDATDGTFVWEYASGSGQAVRDFVFPDRLGRDLYFSTGNRVVALTEDVGQNGAAEKWPPITTINAPSAPTFLTGTTHLFLGDGDGKLHRLSTVDGTESAPFPITLGDGNATVGATTIDTRKGFIYAGTEAGIVYAVQNP
jgi:outer membrane protein assembly factor BamB